MAELSVSTPDQRVRDIITPITDAAETWAQFCGDWHNWAGENEAEWQDCENRVWREARSLARRIVVYEDAIHEILRMTYEEPYSEVRVTTLARLTLDRFKENAGE